MNSEIIAALARLVADEQQPQETIVDTLTRIKAERDQLRATLDGDPYQTATPEQRHAWRLSAIRYADKVESELKAVRLDEATLSAIIFGDDHTVGKGFREMAARVRELLIVANAAADVCGPFAMLDRQGRELVPVRDMDRLRAALKPLIVWPSVAAETGASHDH